MYERTMVACMYLLPIKHKGEQKNTYKKGGVPMIALTNSSDHILIVYYITY